MLLEYAQWCETVFNWLFGPQVFVLGLFIGVVLGMWGVYMARDNELSDQGVAAFMGLLVGLLTGCFTPLLFVVLSVAWPFVLLFFAWRWVVT